MKNNFGKPLTLMALLFASVCATAAELPARSASSPMLSGSQVTEAVLIEALAIDVQAPAEGEGKMRGFRPTRSSEKPQSARPAAGKASLQVTFETNSATLTPESKVILSTLARALQSDRLAGFAFGIEGHADARGDVDGNLKLSQLRAQSVANYLVEVEGMLPERLRAVGKGSAEPMNRQRVDAPENRRVTIVTLKN